MNKREQTLMQEELLHWYDMNYILLPWRVDKDPYKIWISEIMLQQTRVEAVIPYFDRFIKRLPTVHDLATVKEDELMKLWQGLGYYRRAKNLHIAAKQIVNEFDGELPKTKEELMTLQGIGEYTSGAIASIAYDQVAPAVDGNILRIFARLFGVKDDIRQVKIRKEITNLYTPTIPAIRPGDFNQALMDLGRKVCIPSKKPNCEECPLNTVCYAYKNNVTTEIPFLSKKKARKIQNMTILLFTNNNQIWISKRPDKGLLGSLYEYTTLSGHLTEEEIKKQFDLEDITIKKLPKSKHIFTHIEWNMIGYLIQTNKKVIHHEGQYVNLNELRTTYSIPTAFQTYTQYLLNIKK